MEREAPEYDDIAVKKTQEESRKAVMNMTKEEIMKIEDENERRKLSAKESMLLNCGVGEDS